MPVYCVASADITHQLLEGEIVAIDFSAGNYYNLRGAAAVVFEALIQGRPSESVLEGFSDLPADASAQLAQLLARLVEARLIKVAENQTPSTVATTPVVPWTAPSFDVYTDMQQLLLADPIHDVGEGAWPRDI